MNSKIKIGCFFLGLAAFLYSTRHITAALLVTNMNNERANYFEGGYDAIGWGFTFWTFLACLTGLIFFLSGVWKAYIFPRKQKSDQDLIQNK
ncbi:hypothetical protein [Bacillus sp. Marseille-P3661]|uniref:hypothetical protein n=1 Tax=Bacillus sp. Marseille-P3661 TaxID=1936234 RepID=UPI000C825976|nr:hypothetical protein [Bacillus sp. Marseille-P3661]